MKFFRIYLLISVFLGGFLVCAAKANAESSAIARIAFGSCIHQDGPQGVWTSILEQTPQVCLLLGDNIYGDTDDAETLQSRYAQLGSQPGFQKLKSACQLYATWDDHDYGANDAGREWTMKEQSKKLFLDFFEIPRSSARWSHKGIYDSVILGPPERSVQLLLLDLRTFKGPGAGGRDEQGRLIMRGELLGQEQWDWLKQELRKPAKLRLLLSSLQVLPDTGPEERWSLYPEERTKLFELLRKEKVSGVMILSGDAHYGEISVEDSLLEYPLFEFTSSGLNMGKSEWSKIRKNDRRLALFPLGSQFGMLQLDWAQATPQIGLEVFDSSGKLLYDQAIPMSLIGIRKE